MKLLCPIMTTRPALYRAAAAATAPRLVTSTGKAVVYVWIGEKPATLMDAALTLARRAAQSCCMICRGVGGGEGGAGGGRGGEGLWGGGRRFGTALVGGGMRLGGGFLGFTAAVACSELQANSSSTSHAVSRAMRRRAIRWGRQPAVLALWCSHSN